jgi:1,2-diacylglycerol 3-beta-glucosyltransferase
VLRSRGRERMGLSAGLRGNGRSFSVAVLREVPHDAFSIVEDLEYGIRLGMAGHRVHYADEACVRGEMVSSEKDSRSQRTRWEAGRFAIAKTHAPKLIGAALRRRSAVLFDLAMDVLVPPLTYIAALAIAGSAISAAVWLWFGGSALAMAPWLASVAFLALYVLRGVAVAGVGLRGLADLAWAPVYMAWKIALTIRQRGQKKDVWVRTAREGGTPP